MAHPPGITNPPTTYHIALQTTRMWTPLTMSQYPEAPPWNPSNQSRLKWPKKVYLRQIMEHISLPTDGIPKGNNTGNKAGEYSEIIGKTP